MAESIDQNSPPIRAPGQIGLALSGGGFRATLFHLGVVRFLYEANLLHQVRFISGVSGGAILAAHVGLKWDQYVGDANSFAAAANEVVRFTQSDVRNRILRRWLVGWLLLVPRVFFKWSRTGLLKREYYNLYGHSCLKEFPLVYAGDRPRVVLQCASLTTGQPCAFGRSGFMSYEEFADGRGIGVPDDREAPVSATPEVALAVSASSAFPPMFPPVRIAHRDLGADIKQLAHAHYLTDGGVYDNLGIDRPLWFYSSPHDNPNDRLDAFLISDGEGSFDWKLKRAWLFKFALPRNVRATELLMKRLSTFTWRYLSSLKSHKFVGINISQEIQGDLSPETQRAIKNMRTDLDRFSDLEVECVVRQGYAAARAALVAEGWVPLSAPNAPWCPVTPSKLSEKDQSIQLVKSAKRRWLPFVFTNDPCIWVLLFAVLILLAYFVFR